MSHQPKRRDPKSLICPICYCRLPEGDFLEPDERGLWEAELEDDPLVEEILDLVVEILRGSHQS